MGSDKRNTGSSADFPAREPSAEQAADVEHDDLNEPDTRREGGTGKQARESRGSVRETQTPKSQTPQSGSDHVKRDVAAAGAAGVGLAGFAVGVAADDPTPVPPTAASPSSAPVHETPEIDASAPEAEIVSPGPSEIMLVSDALIDEVDAATDGALDGVAILPVEAGLEHVEQVREDMNPSLEHWIMPMDEDTSDDPLFSIQPLSADAEILAADGVEVSLDEIAPPATEEIVVVETGYQSPTAPSGNDAWILAHDTPAEVIAVDGDLDELGEE